MLKKNNLKGALLTKVTLLFYLVPSSLLLFCLLHTGAAQAQVKLATVFANNMVLQRGLPINIWGTATKDEKIKVTLNSKTYQGQANKQGDWLITLPAQQVAIKQSIEIMGENTSEFNAIELNAIKLSNIAFGDVWLASGQSNMEFKLKEVLKKFPQEDKLEQYPDIRQFKVVRNYDFKGPLTDIEKGHWLVASKENVGNFSAVAWFFAKDLYQRYQIPIGIISSSVGATPIESWMSYDSLKNHPKAHALAYKLSDDGYIKQLQNEYAQERRNWREKNNEPTKKLPFMLMHRTSLDFKPIGFYNGMIAPLAKMKFSGVIWYQGESNATDYHNYSDKLSTMINQWRGLFNQPQLPFLFVQLANFQTPDEKPSESEWAELRAEQTQVLKTVENTAMALAIDVGERHNIHPLDKKTVGERLALGARHLVYGEKQLNYTSPLVNEAVLTNGQAIISFKYINEQLVVKGNKLMGFAIAGKDKKFLWANASLLNNKVTVWHDNITVPKYVRYAWANNPEKANLYNVQGLPATPFSVEIH
ncbi:MAG: hypothetical protein HRT37_20120 [Alteromonadaceae bacterium]|nr:hypothetical protein [Alteromonadaceae bacterium]